MLIEINHFIHAAHQLPDSEDLITKQCANLHGHTYKIKVHLDGENTQHGMVIDFKAVKDAIDVLDHRFINDVFKEQGLQEPTTAENIAWFLMEHIAREIGLMPVLLGVCEGFKGDEHSAWVWVKGMRMDKVQLA